MFGKGNRKMSSNDRFVMSAGRKSGNLKAPMVSSVKARGDSDSRSKKQVSGNRPVSPGQVNTFSTRGK